MSYGRKLAVANGLVTIGTFSQRNNWDGKYNKNATAEQLVPQNDKDTMADQLIQQNIIKIL